MINAPSSHTLDQSTQPMVNQSPMKLAVRLESAALFSLALYLFLQLPYAWWWFPVLLFLPDVSLGGYLISPQVGALTYNIAHHAGTAVIVYLLGTMLSAPLLMLAGTILLAHSVFDRILGYGLKYPDAFNNTHLGKIGK